MELYLFVSSYARVLVTPSWAATTLASMRAPSLPSLSHLLLAFAFTPDFRISLYKASIVNAVDLVALVYSPRIHAVHHLGLQPPPEGKHLPDSEHALLWPRCFGICPYPFDDIIGDPVPLKYLSRLGDGSHCEVYLFQGPHAPKGSLDLAVSIVHEVGCRAHHLSLSHMHSAGQASATTISGEIQSFCGGQR